jgi:C-terminal processing protease CtpA/Prc
MNKHFLYLFFGLVFLLAFLSCSAQSHTDREIDNLTAFAKAYGYVKYFHPSTEAEEIDWGWFAVYGSQKVLHCQNEEELNQTLQFLFLPIGPTVTFSSSAPDPSSFKKVTQPEDKAGYAPVYWQHQGVTKDMDPLGPGYQSVRVNSPKIFPAETSAQNQENNENLTDSIMTPIFQGSPSPDEVWIRQIGKNLWIGMPLILQIKDGDTYPKCATSIEQFMAEGELDTPENADSLEFRLGNLINTWNVFQHFYPYFSEMKIDWAQELRNSLELTYSSNKANHENDLKRLTAALKDNHVDVLSAGYQKFAPPIDAEWIEDQLVVTQVFDSGLGIKTGDVIEQIDGIDSKQLFDDLRPLISAATEGYYRYNAPVIMLTGKENTTVNIKIAGKSFEIKRNLNYYSHKNSLKMIQPGYRFLGDDIAYLNLDIVSMDTINKLIPQLEKSRAIIADVRGYPNSNHGLIRHLLSKPDSHEWLHVDNYLFPDQENKAGHVDYGWSMKPKEPYLGDKKIIFITDGRAVSYAESYLGFIDGYDLATIIGQPSSGTNGNVNAFNLPGDYKIFFTGMRVLKHDGSQLHGIGILPDIYVERTLEGVRSGRDEFLEKAIELAKQGN